MMRSNPAAQQLYI